EDVLGAVDHHLDRPQRLLGGLGDPQGGLVKDQVTAIGQAVDQGGVADIALDDADAAGTDSVRDVLVAPTHEVVHDGDGGGAGFDHLIDDERADETGAAGDEHAGAA